MKKQNVIDLAAYRKELSRKPANEAAKPDAPVLAISEELKIAIESLIVQLRSNDKP